VVKNDKAEVAREQDVAALQAMLEADARVAARLKQILDTPGISDKDRKLVERNLARLLNAQELRKQRMESLR
jgi:hypothetical protein